MIDTIVGRIMFACWIMIFLALSAQEVSAKPQIIDVRRNIPLADSDPIYRDYYINAGVESGIQVGAIIDVSRKVLFKDAATDKNPYEMLTPVGKLKIVHSQEKLSVGRSFEVLSRESLPMLEDGVIMSGDLLELATVAAVDNKSNENKTNEDKTTDKKPSTKTPAKPKKQISTK